MRLLIGFFLVYHVSANAPPNMPGFVQFFVGFVLMWGVFATFRSQKDG